MVKKRKVPRVIWRLFEKRARTLAETIVALCTPPATVVKCCCGGNGSKCLGCCANDPISFLLREDDSPEYRMLLNRCFVVVSENAPSVSYFSPACHWSQIEIVRRTLEIILCEQSHATNVICNEYDKSTRSSTVVELLTSPAWSLLLRRVGDDLMVYLLKYTSIFLPLPFMKHYQLTGLPVSNLCNNVSKHATESEYQNSSRDPSNGFQVQALQRKRKRTHNADSTSEKPQVHSSLDSDISLSPRAVIRNCRKHLRPAPWRRKKKGTLGSGQQIKVNKGDLVQEGAYNVGAEEEGQSGEDIEKEMDLGCDSEGLIGAQSDSEGLGNEKKIRRHYAFRTSTVVKRLKTNNNKLPHTSSSFPIIVDTSDDEIPNVDRSVVSQPLK